MLQKFYLAIIMLLLCITLGCYQKPTNQHINLKQASSLNVAIGLTYLKSGKLQIAKQKLLLAIKQDPTNVQALLSIAYFFDTIGHPKFSEIYYHKALKIASDHSQVQNNYGVFLCKQGVYQKGLYYLKLAAHNQTYLGSSQAVRNIQACEVLEKQRNK